MSKINRHRERRDWDKDGVNNGPSSMKIVVKWLAEGNYTRWRNTKFVKGQTKESLIPEILEKLKENGIIHRTKRDIRNRTEYLFIQFRRTRRWVNRTIQDEISKLKRKGLTEEQIASSIQSNVIRRFAYYYELEKVIGQSDEASFSSEENVVIPKPILSSNSVEESEREFDEIEEFEPPRQRSISITTEGSYQPKTPLEVCSCKSMQISNNEKNQSLLNEKLCEMEEMRFEADQKRAEEMFKIEQRRFEIERLSVADERAKTQIAFAKMWKSLGLSNENIVQKINSMWA